MNEDGQLVVIEEEQPRRIPWKLVLFGGGIFALLWWLFGRKGSGGLGEGDTGKTGWGSILLGDREDLSFVIQPNSNLTLRLDGKTYSLVDAIKRAMDGGRKGVRLQTRGDTPHRIQTIVYDSFRNAGFTISEVNP